MDFIVSSACPLDFATSDAFHSTIYVILCSDKWQFALVYLNYIVILSKISGQHIDHIYKIFLLWYNDKATLKLKKNSFLPNTID